MLTGSADTEDAAIVIRDQLRQQVRDNTAARTNVTLGYLLDEWLSGHQVEETTRDSYRLLINSFIRPALGATPLAQLCKQGPRPLEQFYAELRTCRRRCNGRAFVEHRTPRQHECDERCAEHACKPLAVSSVRQCHAVLSGALSAAKRWRNGTTILKDTKTHQMRVIRLDQDTITILNQHKARAEQRCTDLGTTLDDDAFVSSYAPDHRRHCDPDAITHRYAKMAADLGIDTHLHALRHYSATELLAGGVDLRTVAGRLGHAGGGATTLKVYAAWLAGADTKAADLIASRLPRPPHILDERT